MPLSHSTTEGLLVTSAADDSRGNKFEILNYARLGDCKSFPVVEAASTREGNLKFSALSCVMNTLLRGCEQVSHAEMKIT